MEKERLGMLAMKATEKFIRSKDVRSEDIAQSLRLFAFEKVLDCEGTNPASFISTLMVCLEVKLAKLKEEAKDYKEFEEVALNYFKAYEAILAA